MPPQPPLWVTGMDTLDWRYFALFAVISLANLFAAVGVVARGRVVLALPIFAVAIVAGRAARWVATPLRLEVGR